MRPMPMKCGKVALSGYTRDTTYPSRPRTPIQSKSIKPPSLPSGKPRENGKFFDSAVSYKTGAGTARPVRVYEKIKTGIWAYNGLFHLTDAWIEASNRRQVLKFKLVAVEEDAPDETHSTCAAANYSRCVGATSTSKAEHCA